MGVVVSVKDWATKHVSVGDIIVRVDSKYFRPAEVETLLGDPSLAMDLLGWHPSTTVEAMCEEMVAADMELARDKLIVIESKKT